MKLVRFIVLMACLLGAAVTGQAGLSMALTQSIQNSGRGREIVFGGTLTNTSSTEKLFLNDIAVSLGGSSALNLSLNSKSFFSNVPGILLPGESYNESELFRILLRADASPDDYAGAIAIKGGANIFASGDLAMGNFTVLSPDVTVAASDPSASELGPDSGAFTITRSGSAAIDLPVYFSLSGSAVNGVTYNALALTATIPAGSSTALVTVLPIPNNIAEGDRVANLSLGNFTTYNLGSPASGALIIHDKPADAWRFEKFGPNANDPAAADNADWDGDGLRNLVEFALALDPKLSDSNAAPQPRLVDDHLAISFVPNPTALDVNYIVEGSTDLTNWSSADVQELNDPNPTGRRTFIFTAPVPTSEAGFLRLRLVRTDL